MKVSQLIAKLKKMPQHAEVGVAAHDNYEWEIAGWVSSVRHHTKMDFVDRVEACGDRESKDMFKSNPEEWVTLGC